MRPNNFRRIALGTDGAIESARMGHPDFRANGKISATLHADLKWGMVKLTPDQQLKFIRENSATFAPFDYQRALKVRVAPDSGCSRLA